MSSKSTKAPKAKAKGKKESRRLSEKELNKVSAAGGRFATYEEKLEFERQAELDRIRAKEAARVASKMG